MSNRFEFRPSDDLSYQDIIKIGQNSAKFIENRYANAEIYGAFPEIYQLTQPFQGYVSKPLDFKLCNEFNLNPHRTQILYIHLYSPIQLSCQKVLNYSSVKLLSRFTANGKWLEIYSIDATASVKIINQPTQ